MNILIVFCFALVLFLSCLLVAHFGKGWNLKPFVAFGAGALLSVCFLDFLPQAFDKNHVFEKTPFFILLGVMAQSLADIYLLNRLSFLDKWLKTGSSSLPHEHSHTLNPGTVCSVTGCLTICSFFDGIRLFSALFIDELVAFTTAVGLFFHLLSEGVLLAILALSSGIKLRVLLILALCMAGALILGALLAQSFSVSFSSSLLIAFSSGILIYVCFVHLLPLCLKQNKKLWFFSGLVLFSAFHFLI